jgi:hypothetical protein
MSRGVKDKDIEVVILDISPSMGHHLKEALDALLLRVQLKLIQMPHKSEIGMLLLGSRETENNLCSDEDYLFIRECRAIQKIDTDIFRTILEISHGVDAGDWLDAIIVAMDMIINHPGPKKSEKRIILITNDSREIRDFEQIDAVAQEMLNRDIQLEFYGLGVVYASRPAKVLETSEGATSIQTHTMQVSVDRVVKVKRPWRYRLNLEKT